MRTASPSRPSTAAASQFTRREREAPGCQRQAGHRRPRKGGLVREAGPWQPPRPSASEHPRRDPGARSWQPIAQARNACEHPSSRRDQQRRVRAAAPVAIRRLRPRSSDNCHYIDRTGKPPCCATAGSPPLALSRTLRRSFCVPATSRTLQRKRPCRGHQASYSWVIATEPP